MFLAKAVSVQEMPQADWLPANDGAGEAPVGGALALSAFAVCKRGLYQKFRYTQGIP